MSDDATPNPAGRAAAARLSRLLRGSIRLDRLRAELPALLADDHREAADVRRLAPLMPAWLSALFDGSLGERLRAEQAEARESNGRRRMAEQALAALASERAELLVGAEPLLRALPPGDDAPALHRWIGVERARDEVAAAADVARGVQSRADVVTKRLTTVRTDRGIQRAKHDTLQLLDRLPDLRDAFADAERALATVGIPLPPIDPPIPDGTPAGRILDLGMEVFRAATAVDQRLRGAREALDRALAEVVGTVGAALEARAGDGERDAGPLPAAEACLRVADAAEALSRGAPTDDELWDLETEAEAARVAAVAEGRDPGASRLFAADRTTVASRLEALAQGHRRVADELVRLGVRDAGPA
jgi:hypothetical protein